ncbi:MAG: DUF4278 domain-containing protein [Synechococcales cyanobacterium C42_A2020_086]|nr:DUF4278 domain-containing protein [Synechococcales cyanobacterium M58_A2018_015]MBF2073215.1 DUF4278 domain-containing protein [Synechococcales cyanobacterium C42_A2020_086]
MKLTYRGIAYTSPAASVSLQSTTAVHLRQYRGVSYTVQPAQMLLLPQVAENLMYRGAYYRSATPTRTLSWATA